MFTREQFMELSFDQKKEIMDFRAKFHAKKSKATADMERIPKNGFNSHHNYEYARESDVKDKIRPILAENKLSFSIDLLERRENINGKWIRTDVKMLFTITDTETGYFEEFVHEGTAMDTGDKGIYKAYSNTIKYGLMDYFLIPTGDDVEKDSPTIEQPQGNPGQQPQQRGSNQGNRNQGGQAQQQNDKPAWKKVMDAEDQLVQLSGKAKTEIRTKLKDGFGNIGKYKDMDPQLSARILAQLNKWIDQYKNPQG
jgi:hypothetical protein